ncbi:MAG: hypothetical protein PHV37_04765 [Candidatus Gastranaerophilales bacterium]|nr:hypothetical protein [Candidatus Gastranaerophilales bacterium]
MYIVKDLNDFELNSKQRIFVDFIKDTVATSCSYEKIKNRAYQKKYASRKNDFVIYNTQSAYPQINRIEPFGE